KATLLLQKGTCGKRTQLDKIAACDMTHPPTLDADQFVRNGCGYKSVDFHEMYDKNVKFNLMNLAVTIFNVRQGVREDCAPSICTSAVFIALTNYAMKVYQLGGESSEFLDQFEAFRLASKKSEGWNLINDFAEPDKLVTKFNIGKGFVQRSGEFGKQNVPQSG